MSLGIKELLPARKATPVHTGALLQSMSPVLSEMFSIGASLDGRNGARASLMGDIPVYIRQTLKIN